MTVKKFTARPKYSWACQWDGTNLVEIQDFLDTYTTEGQTASEDSGTLTVPSLPGYPPTSTPVGGWVTASPGSEIASASPDFDTDAVQELTDDAPFSFDITGS